MSKLLTYEYFPEVRESGFSNTTFETPSDPLEIIRFGDKRAAGSLLIKRNTIAEVSSSLESVLAVKAGDDLSSLFANQLSASVQLKKLFLFGKVEARIIDANKQAFWARLRLANSVIEIEDIDNEKHFEIDSEDQIQEIERASVQNTVSTITGSIQ